MLKDCINDRLGFALDGMKDVECEFDSNGNCSKDCLLIMSDGDCAFFALQNIMSQIVRYRGEDNG